MDDFLQLQRDHQAAQVPPSPEQLEAVRQLVDQRLGPYRIGPSDVLQVDMTGRDVEPALAQLRVRVDEEGRIDLPIIGGVSVKNMTLQEADSAIRAAIVPHVFANAVVHVQTLVPDPTLVLVRGAVRMPGVVTLKRTERNLIFAVVNAGGASDAASGVVTLTRVRRAAEKINLDLTKAEDLQKALGLDPLDPGDSVYVHAAFPNTFFVGGLVNAPRPVEFTPGVEVNMLQALAASGGLRTDVIPTEATLIRRMPDRTDLHVKLDVRRIGRGLDPNITLAAGDILWIPETAGTRIHGWVNQNIFFRGGISATYNVTGIEFMNRQSLQASNSGGNTNQENNFDPLGFLNRNAALQQLGP